MALERSPMRTARGMSLLTVGAVVLAGAVAALLLARSTPATEQPTAAYAQLENKEGLFPPPPPAPGNDETYVYTPSAEGDAAPSPRGANGGVTPNPRGVRGVFVQTLIGTAGSVVWAQRPTARRIRELYPQRALREAIGGRVHMDCTIQADLTAVCAVANESPAGQGFGRAALAASIAYRAQPTLSDGTSAGRRKSANRPEFRPATVGIARRDGAAGA